MAFPTSPTNGQTVTLNGTTFTYNSANTAWKVTPITVGSRITYTSSNTAPSSPLAGDLWYKINQDIIFEYINDGTTSNWVDISTPILTAASGGGVSNTSIRAQAMTMGIIFGG